MLEPAEPPHSPPPLVVAASLAALEGVGLVVGAVLELAHIESGHVSLSLASAAFFGAYGVFLVVAGLALYRCVPWPRGLVLISQLIIVGLAWGLRDHVAAAVALAVVGVVTIAGLVHPASIETLEGVRERNRDDQDSSSD